MSPAVMRAVYFDLTEDATASTGCSPDVCGSTHEVVHQESFLRSAPTCGIWTRIHNKIWNGCATLWFNVWWVLSSKPWPKFFGPRKFWVDRPTLPFFSLATGNRNFLVWPCKKFYHKRIFSELGACPGSNETKGNSTCKEEIQKKIQKIQKYQKNRYNREIYEVDLQFDHVISCDIELRFNIDATHGICASRARVADIEVNVAWYHMIALRINLMNIWAATIFFLARVVFLSPM